MKNFTIRFLTKTFLAAFLGFATLGTNAQTITTFPWTETFENSSPSRDDWTQIFEVGDMAWTFASSASTGSWGVTAYEGTMFANYPATSHEFYTTKLVSPVLDLTGLTNTSVSFYYINPYWNPDQNILRVYYRTSAESSWVQIAMFNTDIDPWTSSGTINLPNPSATYQIAIECWTDYGYSTLVDQVVVTGEAAVVEVESVEINTEDNVAAEITTQGGTLQLEAVVNPAEVSQSVTWSVVSGSEFGSVSATGLVTAIDSGTVTVRATSVADNSIYDEISIAIDLVVEVESIVISTEDEVPAEINTDGGTLQLEAVVNPAGANQEVTWSVVSGSDFGSVSATGLVTAIDSGTVTVRATSVEDGSVFDEIDILITIPLEVETVEINTENDVAAEITTAGGTLQLEAVVNPEGVNQAVTWSVVSGNAFASVDNAGLVTAIANGTATIRATSVEDTSKFDEIDVVVAIVLGAEDFTSAQLLVYPNPVESVLNFTCGEEIDSIEIYTLTGQRVLRGTISATSGKIEVSHLAAGTYLMRITAGSSTKTVEFIKK